MEGGGSAAATIDTITTAITGMATTVQTSALGMIGNIMPVLAVVIAAIIVAKLGVRLVKRFSN